MKRMCTVTAVAAAAAAAVIVAFVVAVHMLVAGSGQAVHAYGAYWDAVGQQVQQASQGGNP